MRFDPAGMRIQAVPRRATDGLALPGNRIDRLVDTGAAWALSCPTAYWRLLTVGSHGGVGKKSWIAPHASLGEFLTARA